MPITMIGKSLVVLCLAFVASTDAALDDAKPLIEWLEARGGVFSSKVDFQPIYKSDPSSPNGVFALSSISKGEELIVIPRHSVFTAKNDSFCDTAVLLVEEHLKGNASAYYPYTKYVFENQHYGRLPAAWSEEGQNVLATIIGRELEPADIADISFESDCGVVGNELHEHAYLTVISRRRRDKLLPVLDMVNHRNGYSRNVDHATSAHGTGDFRVVALRDIAEGEQLYISYNECADLDCEGIEHTYVLPQILREYGYVEQYPRRWRFDTPYGEIVFELDEVDAKIQLHWLSGTPDMSRLNWLGSHLKRLKDLQEYVEQTVVTLTSKHEKDVITEFRQALLMALEYAIDWSEVTEDTCIAAPYAPCALDLQYDDLTDKPDPLEYNVPSICNSYPDYMYSEYALVETFESQYQSINFTRSETNQDVCLELRGWLETCTSFRPTYHEVFVHYPARYLKDVRRVIFLGGGDNMAVHEIMKYPNLELVVGMELDQQVVRSSFKNFGTLPHFDKVQWWFGDACKSLLMLPAEYFGSFDLVLVDLLTYVADTLMVTKSLSIMNVAELLAKPDGIIARNEDFNNRRNAKFAKHTVFMENHGVPMICFQSLAFGSNSIDLLREKLVNHNIESVYFDADGKMFNDWLNYQQNGDHAGVRCREKDRTVDEASRGVFVVLEVEDAAGMVSTESVQTGLTSTLSKLGLTFKAVEKRDDTFVVTMEEGYIVVRMWPEHQYCALDVHLWSAFDKLEVLTTEILHVLGGKKSSSFRIVTGGMHGVDNEQLETGLNSVLDQCHMSETAHDARDFGDDGIFEKTVTKMLSLAKSVPEPVVAVVCADKQSQCKSYEAIDGLNDTAVRAVQLWSCPGMLDSSTEDGLQRMFACESTVETDMRLAGRKISGIVFDDDAPRAMGQIVLKILSDARNRKTLLEDEYFVLASTTAPWRTSLLERFRTDLVRFSPAFHASVVVNSSTSRLQLGLFASGMGDFFDRLVDVVENIETDSGLDVDVKTVKDGVVNMVADFNPTMSATDNDYDYTQARKVWFSQRSVGRQTFFMFDSHSPKSSLAVNESILVNEYVHIWEGEWQRGTVVANVAGDSYLVAMEDGNQGTFDRNSLRKAETAEELSTPLDYGERIVVLGADGWYQGTVVEWLGNEKYTVQIYDSDGTVTAAERDQIVRQIEHEEVGSSLPFSLEAITGAFSKALNEGAGSTKLTVHEVGKGCVIIALGRGLSIVASWNGKTRIDVSVFTTSETRSLPDTIEKALLKEIPHLMKSTRDEFPRGFGGVVNLQSEINWNDVPFWTTDKD